MSDASKMRRFSGVCYPESFPGWNGREDLVNFPSFVRDSILASYPKAAGALFLHDLDCTDSGAAIKPHCHFFIRLANPVSADRFKDLVGVSHNKDLAPQPWQTESGFARYVSHADEPAKHQYSLDGLVSFGDFHFEEVSKEVSSKCATDEFDWLCVLDTVLKKHLSHGNHNAIYILRDCANCLPRAARPWLTKQYWSIMRACSDGLPDGRPLDSLPVSCDESLSAAECFSGAMTVSVKIPDNSPFGEQQPSELGTHPDRRSLSSHIKENSNRSVDPAVLETIASHFQDFSDSVTSPSDDSDSFPFPFDDSSSQSESAPSQSGSTPSQSEAPPRSLTKGFDLSDEEVTRLSTAAAALYTSLSAQYVSEIDDSMQVLVDAQAHNQTFRTVKSHHDLEDAINATTALLNKIRLDENLPVKSDMLQVKIEDAWQACTWCRKSWKKLPPKS